MMTTTHVCDERCTDRDGNLIAGTAKACWTLARSESLRPGGWRELVQAPAYDYSGLDSRGLARSGRTQVDPYKFVRKRYYSGWRKLSVRSVQHGHEVGGIGHGLNDHQRTWWAEAPSSPPTALEPMLSTAPLVDFVARAGGPKAFGLTVGQVRYLYKLLHRSEISIDAADRCAVRLHVHPSAIWGDRWFEVAS